MLTFVFSTILGWSYYGEKAAEYLLGTVAVMPYRVLRVIAVTLGYIYVHVVCGRSEPLIQLAAVG